MRRLAKVTINGMAVSSAPPFSPPVWAFQCGPTAPSIVWTLDPDVAAQVLIEKEVEIKFDVDGLSPLTIKRVVVVRERPSSNRFYRSVELSDVRWYWTRRHIRRSFNIRIRTGSSKFANIDGRPSEVADQIAKLTFAPFSLLGNKSVTPDGMLADILQDLEGFNWVSVARQREQLKINDVDFDDSGDVAVARALALAGGVDVQVTPEGKVLVFDRVLGAEKKTVEALVPYELRDKGRLVWVSMEHELPSEVHTLYQRVMEVRLDGIEADPSGSVSVDDDTPTMDQVSQIVDERLTVVDPFTGEATEEVRGTFWPLDQLLASMNATAPNAESPPGPLDRTKIQDCYLGSSNLRNMYVKGFAGIEPDLVWEARVSAILASYRVLWQANRQWMTRVVPGSLQAVRVGVVDNATGTQQSSPVWMDYTVRPTQQSLAKNPEGLRGWITHTLPPLGLGQEVGETKAYTDNAPLKDFGRPAPAVLTVRDSYVGLLSFELVRDYGGQNDQLVPGLVQKLPCIDFSRVASGAGLATWEQCQLVRNFRIVTIVSAAPAGPNNEAQFHVYTTRFADAVRKLGVDPSDMLANGPTLERRVGGAIVQARFAWDDEKRDQILGAFDAAKPFPTDLVPVNDAELQDYADSLAATAYANRLDHYEGTAEISFEPSLFPVGSVTQVLHVVGPDGFAATVVTAEARGAAQNPENFLRSSTRRVIFRELGP